MRSVREVSDKMVRGRCTVYTPRRLPGDEISGKRNDITGTIKEEKIHCSVQDDDVHEFQLQVDHKSLLGCHHDDEDDCVVEEG